MLKTRQKHMNPTKDNFKVIHKMVCINCAQAQAVVFILKS